MQSNETNEHYRRLAFEMDDGDRGRMLSGWQCDNPFVGSLLKEVRFRASSVDFRDYTYFDADEELAQKILTLHDRIDRAIFPAVLAGAGSSPLISTFVAWLAEIRTKQVHFIPPLYHTVPTGLARYGITLAPVARYHVFEPSFDLRLPSKRSILLLSDPVWYAGTAVPMAILEEIRRWQERTGSMVFVDGSLQYLPWDGTRQEGSSMLVPDLTFRLVSPCKQLAVNGYRFAYLLLPRAHEPTFSWIYANLFGPASAESIVFAHAAIEAVLDGSIPGALASRASTRFRSLVNAGRVEMGPYPDRGYYVFVRIKSDASLKDVSMDGRFFDQPRLPGFSKVNLLSPSYDRSFK